MTSTTALILLLIPLTLYLLVEFFINRYTTTSSEVDFSYPLTGVTGLKVFSRRNRMVHVEVKCESVDTIDSLAAQDAWYNEVDE